MADYYQRQLLGRIYQRWKDALMRKYLIQQHEHRLAQLQEKVLMRWAFERWRSCSSSPVNASTRLDVVFLLDMRDLVDEERTMEMAEQYSTRRILVRSEFFLLVSFASIFLSASNDENSARLRRKASTKTTNELDGRATPCANGKSGRNSLTRRTVLSVQLERRVYRIWKDRLEDQENISMIEEFHKANRFYQMKITIRYWFYWRRYVNDCREENVRRRFSFRSIDSLFGFQARLQAADRYYHSKLLRRYFTLLRLNIDDERHEILLEKRADEHFRSETNEVEIRFFLFSSMFLQNATFAFVLRILASSMSNSRTLSNELAFGA